MQAVNIPEFQMYDQALMWMEEKKRNNQPFLPPSTVINTINNMYNNMSIDNYNYHCYNIYRLLSVSMLKTNSNLKQLTNNFKKVQLGTSVMINNLTSTEFELLSIYIEYYQ